MNYQFKNGEELIALCRLHSVDIGELMLLSEEEASDVSRETVRAEMALNLEAMKNAITKGMDPDIKSVTGLSGGDAYRLNSFAERSYLGREAAEVAAAAMATVEVNAAMGRIVAAPTAGASGILPAIVTVAGGHRGMDDDAMINGLFAAGAIGVIIAENATISGAAGGCQAEVGAASAMAAAALCAMSGAKPDVCLDAAAMALKNLMGLVCDPVAGLVECPCIKRNAMGAVCALLSADMALSGIRSHIPFDETVSAMYSVGRLMSPDLRETARGGIAATPTARRLRDELGLGSAGDID